MSNTKQPGLMSRLFSMGVPGWSNTGAMHYDVLKDNQGRRAVPHARVRHQDRKMKDRDRRSMMAKLGQLYDNFALAGWMVRIHLDYVATLSFKADTGVDRLDRQMDEFMQEWDDRLHCHAQRKHPFSKIIRIIEELRVCYGDCFILKIGGNGPLRGSIQIIEGDRVIDPRLVRGQEMSIAYGGAWDESDRMADEWPWYSGVRVSKNGIAEAYAVHKRTREGDLVWERNVAARNMVHHGFFTRHDQVRGLSPFVPAANQLHDIYEGYDYALKKVKVAQALAAVITRDSDIGVGAYPTKDTNGDGLPDRDFEWDLSDGPKVFDLLPGEGVSMVQGSSDSMDAIALLKMMTQSALKAMDIPMSYFSEDFSNWFGQRASGIHFERAAKPKRKELIGTLNEITKWRLGMAVADGEIELPSRLEFADLHWEWVPQSVGWFDPLKEAQGYRALIDAGLDSPIDICKANGKNWEQILEDRKLFEERAEKLGVALNFSMGSSSSSNVEQPAQPEKEEPEVMPPGQQPEQEEGEDDDDSGDE